MKNRYLALASLAALLLTAAMLCFCGCKGCTQSCLPIKPPSESGEDQVVDIEGTSAVTFAPGQTELTPGPDESLAPGETPGPGEPGWTEDPGYAVPSNTPEPQSVEIGSDIALLAANSKGTYGVASDGSIRFIGRSAAGQHRIYDWQNIVSVAMNESSTAAVHRNGTLLFAGKEVKSFAPAKKWEGVKQVAMGEKHLVGLTGDGTVLVCGTNVDGCCNISGWGKAGKIAAGSNFTAALTSNGVKTTLGSDFDSKVNQKQVKDIAAAGERLTVLYSDGTVSSFKKGSSSVKAFNWSGIVKVFASPEASFGINGEGRLFTDSSIFNKQVTDVYSVAGSSRHVVVLHGNGKCESFGENGDMQGSVSNWRLLPYVTGEGYLMGLYQGMSINGARAATGRRITWTEPATGRKQNAVCVLLGDVNGDGAIDERDVSAVSRHISGEIKLLEEYGRAANIVADSSKPNSVDMYDLELLTAEAGGKKVIDQYAKTDMYTAPLADAKRKNADALGYITLKGTNISYPIMYDREWYYNDHNIDRKEIVSGSIYFYWSKANKNIVITGHNARTSGTMFHELHTIQNKASNLKTYKNRVWQINAYGKTGYWEVWSLYEEGAFSNPDKSSLYYNTNWPNTFNALSEKEKQAWIDYQLKKSEINLGVKVSTDDRFMTLVTCGDHHSDSQKGARLYIFLRWIGQD